MSAIPCPPGAELAASGTPLLITCVALVVSADGPAYLPWLATLPPVGAMAAGLARYMGAEPRQRLIAAVSPAIYLAFDFFLMSLRGSFFWRIPVYWVIVPAVLCAIGAAPFLGRRRDPMEPQPLQTMSS